MIARVATFHQLDADALDPKAVVRLRATIKSAPGYVAGFHLRNPEPGRLFRSLSMTAPSAIGTRWGARASWLS
jgi:hypothetical protein